MIFNVCCWHFALQSTIISFDLSIKVSKKWNKKCYEANFPVQFVFCLCRLFLDNVAKVSKLNRFLLKAILNFLVNVWHNIRGLSRQVIKTCLSNSACPLIRSRLIESAAYCNQIFLVPSYLNSTQKASVNWIIRLLLSLLCWPKVIL